MTHFANYLKSPFVSSFIANDARSGVKSKAILRSTDNEWSSVRSSSGLCEWHLRRSVRGEAATLYGVHPAAHTQTRRRTHSECGLCEHLLVARTARRRSLSQRCHGSIAGRLGIGSLASGSITAVKLASIRPCRSSLVVVDRRRCVMMM